MIHKMITSHILIQSEDSSLKEEEIVFEVVTARTRKVKRNISSKGIRKMKITKEWHTALYQEKLYVQKNSNQPLTVYAADKRRNSNYFYNIWEMGSFNQQSSHL